MRLASPSADFAMLAGETSYQISRDNKWGPQYVSVDPELKQTYLKQREMTSHAMQ